MEKVLVTGADGFIGSHLTEKLLEKGYHVKALVKYSSNQNIRNLSFLAQEKLNEIEIIRGDIKDFDLCNDIIKDCDYVFHLASLISIPYSYIHPNEVLQTNVLGTTNLLNASLKNSRIKRFIHTSTSEVYGSATYTPIDEKHPLQPQSPYSASKISADSFVMSYYLSFGLPVTIIRPFNTYGPRQSLRAIIPKIITHLLSNLDVGLGNLNTQRDFLFVKDTVNGFIMSLNDNCSGEVFNIGTGKSISMKNLFELIQSLCHKENIKLVIDKEFLRPEKSEVNLLQCNYDKMHLFTNWKPVYGLNDGLLETIEWFQEHNSLIKSSKFQFFN